MNEFGGKQRTGELGHLWSEKLIPRFGVGVQSEINGFKVLLTSNSYFAYSVSNKTIKTTFHIAQIGFSDVSKKNLGIYTNEVPANGRCCLTECSVLELRIDVSEVVSSITLTPSFL